MDPWDGLVDAATLARLQRARAGLDESRRLWLGVAEAGDRGVVQAHVASVAAVRPYQRRGGGRGEMARVTLADPTGSAELVLWDGELSRLRSLLPGAAVRLRGATVRAGYRGGGIELALGTAELEVVANAQLLEALDGRLTALGQTQPVEDAGRMRFTAEAELATAQGSVRVVAWDEAVLELRRAGVGGQVRLDAQSHPLLAGTYIAGRRRETVEPAGPPG